MMVLEATPPTATARLHLTADEFDTWIRLPENVDQNWELIAGEVYDVVAHWDSSKITAILSAFITMFVLRHDLGAVTSSDGGYKVAGARFIPDVGFVKKERLTDQPIEEGYYPIAPDLAVEVMSPTDTDQKLRRKIAQYLLAGTTVWLVDPFDRMVEIYAPGQPLVVLGVEDTLEGGELLPGFSVAVKEFLR